MFGLFGRKKAIEDLRGDVQNSFNHVKRDFNKVSEWIKHLDDKHGVHASDVEQIKDQLMSLQAELMEIKDFVSFFGPQLSGGVSKQAKTGVVDSTAVNSVQTPVQTPVQTVNLEKLTVMERAIVWTLLNSDMKLSYEDLAALLGKDKSTIRGQINTIKQKEASLIEEVREGTGKKRLYIPGDVRVELLKRVKVKVKGLKSGENWKSES